MAKSDEEYHFSEPETPVSYTTESSRPRQDKDFQNQTRRRNVIFMFAILMVFWAIYKFMGFLFSQVKVPVKPKQVVQQPIPKIQPSVQPAISESQLQEMTNQKNRLNSLESQMVNFQSTLADLNTKLDDLSAQVNNLVKQANKSTPPPAATIRKWHLPKKNAHKKSYRPYIYSYQVQAALPGRAWLMREDGITLTVSLGDVVPGYGTVIGIDPDMGVVQLSSGATIKYISQ